MTEKVKEAVQGEIIEAGYQLYDVRYIKEDGNNILMIIIDSEKGIEVEDCVKVTGLINPIIDKLDPIEEEYVLDVCSIGKEN